MEQSFTTTSKSERKIIGISFHLFCLPKKKGRHYTFITKRNNIICYGVNNINKTDPLPKKMGIKYPNIHSEINAIKNFPFPISDLKKFKIYNVRIDRNMMINMSKPCTGCKKILSYFGVNSVFYTSKEGFNEFIL